MLTAEKLIREMRPYFNEICLIYDFSLGRLVGIHEGEDDFYYIIHFPYGHPHGRELPEGGKEVLCSAVGYCTTMKGHERYDALDANFARNGCPPIDEFIIGRD